jgi:hypothetical protein
MLPGLDSYGFIFIFLAFAKCFIIQQQHKAQKGTMTRYQRPYEYYNK